MKNILLVMLLGMMTVLFAGCEQKGPAERAGEKLDETVEDVGNKIEDACEDLKEKTGADDEDC